LFGLSDPHTKESRTRHFFEKGVEGHTAIADSTSILRAGTTENTFLAWILFWPGTGLNRGATIIYSVNVVPSPTSEPGGLMIRTVRVTILAALACLVPATVLAQTSASVVNAHPAVSVDKVKQASRFQAAVVLDISSGYHINSSRPSESYLIATALKLEKQSGITAGPVVYPRAQIKKFSFSEKPLSVYEGRAVLKFTATASPAVPVGNHSIRGKLTVQACNDEACLQPKTIDVEIPFEVVTAGTQTNAANPDIFGTGAAKRR
jgi:hypothetical protein